LFGSLAKLAYATTGSANTLRLWWG